MFSRIGSAKRQRPAYEPRGRGALPKATLLTGLVVSLVTASVAVPFAVRADQSVTYTSTQTIPVPPASAYAGSGGGDGWAVATTSTAVYNIFHHSSSLQISCHLQADASPCWSPKTITDTNGNGYATSGHPGMWIAQDTGRLYAYVTRTSDSTGGVVCVDTTQPPDQADPFCGFTELTSAGDSPLSAWSAISAPAVVGTRWYAFNYAPGFGVLDAKNKLLCFDLTNASACASQPYDLNIGAGTVSTGWPSPVVAAIAGKVIVPISVDGAEKLACYDGDQKALCTGRWPLAIDPGYLSNSGAPFPITSASGAVVGLCLPTGTKPCYSLAGDPAATPDGINNAISVTDVWNGPAFVLGPRVYLPNGNTNSVECYDYSTSASCANFPKTFSNLGYLYTVNSDPQRPTCIWVNADNGLSQIQNFDAYTGGACGEGPIRVLASTSVVPTQLCLPTTYTSLQVTSPDPTQYTSGSVAFLNGDGRQIDNIANRALDATGTVSLADLQLNTSTGLPQFLITLVGIAGTPGSVTVKLTWTGTNDPTCIKPGTVVGSPTDELQFGNPTPADGALVKIKKNTSAALSYVATDSDPHAVVAMRAGPIPPGASFTASTGNPSTGRLTWTPKTAGNYLVKVEARNQAGHTATRTTTIIVYDGNEPPDTPIPGTTTGTTYTTGGGRGAAGGWRLPANPNPAVDCPSMQVTSLQNASGIPVNYHGPLFVDAAPVTGCIAAARSLAGYANVGGSSNAAHQWGLLGAHPWGVSLVQDFTRGAWGNSIIMQGCSSNVTWTGSCPTPYLPAFVVRTGIWDTYRTQNGIDILGPPLGNEVAVSDREAYQIFAGGMIAWSAQRGGRIVANRTPNNGGSAMSSYSCDFAWTSRGYAGRNCTDYVAWRLATDGHEIPGGMGNATDWPKTFARLPGWTQDQTPRPGDAAVQTATASNRYGHVAYVRAVNPDGTLSIEDFNRNPRCQYSITDNVNPANFATFLHPPVNSWP